MTKKVIKEKEDDGEKKLEIMRHSAAHLLAAAVQVMYPKTKFGVGPVVENGFYYDMDIRDAKGKAVALKDEDLPKIEEKMRELAAKNLSFERKEIGTVAAINFFKKAGQTYKVELLKDLQKKGTTSVKTEEIKEAIGDKKSKVSLYTTGDFTDLCRGPHIKATKEIGVFKLRKLAGAYWRGNEKNPMLTRVYGLAFGTEKELNDYLALLVEAERRDHRKLGEEMELFAFSPNIGPGLVLWLPNGNIIKEELENWAKEIEAQWGYVRVTTPIITKQDLFYVSEHLPHYKESMYSPMDIDGEKYYIKPMNCPFHHTIFGNRKRSYRELPMRLAEYGWCHRYEDSGSLFGLMRVRGMQMNDAHIYCTKEQAVQEFVDVIKLHQYYYDKLGIKDYYMELALRNPANKKYHGDDEMWREAEGMMREAMEKSGVPYVVQNDGAAFYGPKIDFQIKSVIGRVFTASTNQIDLFMPKKFDLKYVDKEGKEQYVACIHRAPLGTHERFVGFLIEHFAGAFPTWLHPTQVQIIPVGRDHIKIAHELKVKLVGARVTVDEADETVGYKIRRAEKQKVPYMLVIGDKEKDLTNLSVRIRGKKETIQMPLTEFAEKIQKEIKERL
jgi:threonyl-tRNA synthetase